jgi:hypothetical protein
LRSAFVIVSASRSWDTVAERPGSSTAFVFERIMHAIGSATVHLVLWSSHSLSLSMSLLPTGGRPRDSSQSTPAAKANGADSYFSPVGDANERTKTASSERAIAVAEE